MSVLAITDSDRIPGFESDPWWLVLLKVLAIFVLLVVLTLFNIWFERRVVARMQHRVGPNKNGPFGLLQSLADGVKLALKEEIIPTNADKIVYWIAPIIAAIPCFLTFAVIPLGPTVSIFGVETRLQLTDFPVAVLMVLAFASIGVYGIVLAGWSSGSTYPLLGGLRSSAQVISYEIAMGLSFIGVFLYAGTMSTSEIVDKQTDLWYGIILIPSFVIYLIAMVGETNRAPFDLPEAEGELVGGFHTEYTSFKFAMFFLAEYINMVNVAAIATTLFLGGWRAPWPISAINDGMFNTGWWPILWFLGKVMAIVFVFIWLRGTLPRLRYDQFMSFGWKKLIPISLIWIAFVAGLRLAQNEGWDRTSLLWVIGIIGFVALCLALIPERKTGQDMEIPEALLLDDEPEEQHAYPIPSMPGHVAPQSMAGAATAPTLAALGVRRTPVTTPAAPPDETDSSSPDSSDPDSNAAQEAPRA